MTDPPSRKAPPLDAFTSQLGLISDWLAELAEPDLQRPTVCGSWDVRTLLGHLVLISTGYLRVLELPSSEPAIPAWQFVAGYLPAAAMIDQLTRDVTGDKTVAQLGAELEQAKADIAASRPVGGKILAGPRGPISDQDWLRTRLLDIVMHADDLSQSVPDHPPVAMSRAAMADSVRLVAAMLQQRYPGRSVEVRIPPFAAVQCVAGPRHTRGTPANVIEMAPLIFLRLAAGRVSWRTAVHSAAVQASGNRADLSEQMPLLS